jgi:cytidyltransferase-like protein
MKDSTVLVSGHFNILHPGHQRLLKFAKESGGKLIVAVESDRLAGNSAHIPEDLRLEGIRSCLYVDEAFIFDGDILLISEDGANLLARTYPIAFSVAGRCWVNNHAHVVRFKKITSQKFVEFYLNSISLKPYVSGMAQPKLNQAMLNKIPIPFPALDIQEKYLRLFESIKKYTSITMKSQQRKITELESLKQSILKQAFNGELVKAA